MGFLSLSEESPEEIVFETFDMSELQRDIFSSLRDKQLTIKEIVGEVDRSRSTVQRAVQDLHEKDILIREGKTDKTVYYVYTTVPMENLRKVAKEAISQWYDDVSQRLSEDSVSPEDESE